MRTKVIDQNLLLELTRKRVDIDTLLDQLTARGVFEDEDEAALVREHRKKVIRRELKQIKDEEGFPLIFSLAELDSSGHEIRKYKQESLFNVEDYKQALEYCRQHKNHWGRLERRLMKNAKKKFGEGTTLFG